MIPRPDSKWQAQGRIASVDWDERLIEFRYDGDLPPVLAGRYVLIPADTYSWLKRESALWRGLSDKECG